MREAVRGLSGWRRDLGAPRVCPDLWHWAVSDASARARLGPNYGWCQDEKGYWRALGPESGSGGSLGIPRAMQLGI